jgi:hypothetical protein
MIAWKDTPLPKRTSSGKKTALGAVEEKLEKEYGGNKSAIYGTLNKVGLMKGSKVTKKGERAAR